MTGRTVCPVRLARVGARSPDARSPEWASPARSRAVAERSGSIACADARDATSADAVLRAGFTLIELLAVLVIIGILATFLIPNILGTFDTAEVSACNANLREIHKGLLVYQQKYKRVPSQSGARFLAELYAKGGMDRTKSGAMRLTCPAVDVGALEQTALGLEPTDWFTDVEAVDGGWTTYAARDCEHHPLRKFPVGGEPIVGDDNDGGMNHETTTNVLFGDGTVETFELLLLQEEGVVGPDEPILLVGPDSPVEELRKLSLD